MPEATIFPSSAANEMIMPTTEGVTITDAASMMKRRRSSVGRLTRACAAGDGRYHPSWQPDPHCPPPELAQSLAKIHHLRCH